MHLELLIRYGSAPKKFAVRHQFRNFGKDNSSFELSHVKRNDFFLEKSPKEDIKGNLCTSKNIIYQIRIHNEVKSGL